MGLEVHYPITRPFASRWFAIVTYSTAFILLVLLVVVNTALAGYETVTIFTDSYNATRPLWFHKFLVTQTPKPGTLCDAKLFNIGDTFSTNYSIFQWQVEYISRANAASSGFTYEGNPLDSCDVTAIYIDTDIRTWNMDINGVMTCKPTDGSYEITARSSYSISGLAGKYRPILGVTGVSKSASSAPRGDNRAVFINTAIQVAANDVADIIALRLFLQAATSPVQLSMAIELPWCPQVSASASCATTPPHFTILETDAIYSNLTLVQSTEGQVSDQLVADFYTPIANLVQIVYASFRVDLGIASPNNILIHNETWPSTLNATFPKTSVLPASESRLSSIFKATNDSSFPLSTSGTAEIRVVYPCKFQQRKKLGSAIIAVISATSAMFTAAWSVFLIIAATFAKRDPKANECLHQCDDTSQSSEKDGLASERKTLMSS
ncbi:hypothetical protein DL96DRAFT_1505124 [Flagelloscypha sp. PMI_526]|nr:hypothetical protein DL96DRAFT_1505124 [Flagelloscypha sp. PMI_526]